MATRQPRLPVIDSLRGLAAIYVVLFHTALVPRPNLPLPYGTDHIVMFGGTGVILFFVISGFSLSMTMARHERAASPILSYGISRFFKIMPMFYVLLLASVMRDNLLLGEPLWAGIIVGNALVVFNFFPGRQEGIVWASWTIGVEMVYYALFPLIHLLSVRNKVALVAVVLAAYGIMTHIGVASRIYVFSFLGFIPIFVLGELTFLAYSQLRSRATAGWIGGAATLAGGALLIGCVLAYGSGTSPTMRYPIGLGFAFVVLGFTLRPVRALEGPILGFYGSISYSLYLCHAPVIFFLAPLLQRIVGAAPGALAYPICAIMALGVSTAFGWLGYRFIEQPGILLGKVLTQWAQNKMIPLVATGG